MPDRFGDNGPSVEWLAPSASVQAVWGCLGDPALVTAVAWALVHHPDLAMAASQLAQTEAGVRLRQAERRPRLSVSAAASRARLPEDERMTVGSDAGLANRFKLGLAAQWDLDLQGRLRMAADAETARWAQARAQVDDVRRRVAADVAMGVLQLRALQERLQARDAALQAQRSLLALAERRQVAGLASVTEATRERAALAQEQAARNRLALEWRDRLQNLAVKLDLPAATVQRLLVSVTGSGAAVCRLDPGLPADLLTRRPDLLAAYQGVVAASAASAAARAGSRPNLVLDSALGWSALSLSGLSAGGALLASVGSSLDLRLFDFGRIDAEIDRSKAAERESWLNYRTAARQAVAEVESALDDITAAQAVLSSLDSALDQQGRAVADAGRVVSAGLSDPVARLTAELTQTRWREQQIEARGQLHQAVARLIRDLGPVP